MLNIGLIQPETIPGHFPKNLRAIVELYRFCLDAGADLVLCPPLALSGFHTGELAQRSGFRAQNNAALSYLVKEIASVPLLLGAVDGEQIRFYLLRDGELFPQQAVITATAPPRQMPFLSIQTTTTTPFFSVTSWDTSEPLQNSTCLLFHTPVEAWHEGILEEDEKQTRLLAQNAKLPVFTIRLAGGEGEYLLPGASSAWSAQGVLLKRMRFMERDYAVISPSSPRNNETALPSASQQIRHALQKGTIDFIRKSGHNAVCFNIQEGPATILLAKLLKEKWPSLPITGLIPTLPDTTENLKKQWQDLADTIGLNTIPFPLKNMDQIQDAYLVASWLMHQWAEEEGALFLSSLSGTDIITNPDLLHTAIATDLMPLGDLYETELADLFPDFFTSTPEARSRDGFLIRLLRNHDSATKLVSQFPESESEIRRLQRRIHASEWMRRKLPPSIILRSTPNTPLTPYIHQLAD